MGGEDAEPYFLGRGLWRQYLQRSPISPAGGGAIARHLRRVVNHFLYGLKKKKLNASRTLIIHLTNQGGAIVKTFTRELTLEVLVQPQGFRKRFASAAPAAHLEELPRPQKSSCSQRRLNALTPGYIKGTVVRSHPMVWSLALCPDDTKQDSVMYGAEFGVVFLAKGPRTASIQEGLDSPRLNHSGLEGERDFRLVVELPRLMRIQHVRVRLVISTCVSGTSVTAPPR